MSNVQVIHKAALLTVTGSYVERTRQQCRQPGEYLLIEDTTLLDYSRHGAAEELGIIGTVRGFELHSTVAVRVEGWTLEQRPEGTVVGLFDQQCRRPRRVPTGEKRGEWLSRPRKTQAWAAGIKKAGGPPNESRWIYVADRESDFYEPLRICQQHGVDWVVRAYHDHWLADETGHMRAAVAQGPVVGQTTVEVRARGGNRPARPRWKCGVCVWIWPGPGVREDGRSRSGTWG